MDCTRCLAITDEKGAPDGISLSGAPLLFTLSVHFLLVARGA